MPPTIERRTVPVSVRADDDGKSISGYASVFYDGSPETEFELWDGAVERIDPGAFDEALGRDDVAALFNHDSSQVLGRSSAKTLALSTDKRGLKYDIDVGDTTIARDVVEHIRRGDVTGSSFAFIPTKVRWEDTGDQEVRTILGLDLFDVGPVTFPAYSGTTTGVRSSSGIDEARACYEREKKRRLDRIRRRARTILA